MASTNSLQRANVTVVPHRRTILVPAAYSETVMPALRLTRSSQLARRMGRLLIVALVCTLVLVAFASWQQSIFGSGNVLAYLPDQRQQEIQAPIEGRIVRWGEGIFENARVTEGQLIAEIQDLDAMYTDRLMQQLSISKQVVAFNRQQLEANQRALEHALSIVTSFENQLHSYQNIKIDTIASLESYIEMARRKVSAEEQQLQEYLAAIPQIQAEYDRMKVLEAEGNIALQKVQEVERKLNEQQAKVRRAEQYVAAARDELAGKIREQSAKIEKAQVDIDYVLAALRKANGDVAKTESDIAKAEQELNKAEKEVLDMEVKLSRQENQKITAPFEGFIVQITPNMNTALLKKGDSICSIVPYTTDRSVQIWLDGRDAPLVEPGRHVRLQFEGWPAVQFSGWPSVAVGTFGGEVVSVDATDDGKGRFRVLIRPAHDDAPWPEERFLRQGVRANGWVLLEQVPLWFEVWRRLNGFPPVVDMGDDKSKSSKPPKLPK